MGAESIAGAASAAGKRESATSATGLAPSGGGAGGLVDTRESSLPIDPNGNTPGVAAVSPAGAAVSSAGAVVSRGFSAEEKGASRAKEPAEKKGMEEQEQEEQLGQGGTSTVSGTSTLTHDAEAGGGGVVKGVGQAAGAGVIAGGASSAMTTMALMNWLKMAWFSAMAAAQNLWAMVGAMVMKGISAVTGFFASIGGAVGSALGISTMAGAIASGTAGVLVAAVAVAGLLAGINRDGQGMRDGALYDCRVGSVQTAAMENTDPNGIDAKQNANAKTVYSVLAAWGMPKENIAGILGNWQAESHIDPTSVQGMFGSPFQMTDEKKAAAENTNNGIGLGQWTFGRNTNLREFAESSGSNWWSLTTQLAFMVSSAEGGNAEIIKGMISTSQGTPEKAALYFHDEWERSADTSEMAPRRATYAKEWMGKMAGWTANQALANSVLQQAGTTLEDANARQLANAKKDCRSLDTQNVMLRDGGMTLEEAQELIDLYNEEGDRFLDGRYGQYGGPGSCGDNHAMNCVSFSTYFLNKYTAYQQYPWGNGIDTARTVSKDTGKPLLTTPVAYSVASGPGSSAAGHTMIVLGVEGDQVIIGEAGYCAFMGRVRVTTVDALQAEGWVFVDLNDMMLDESEIKTA